MDAKTSIIVTPAKLEILIKLIQRMPCHDDEKHRTIGLAWNQNHLHLLGKDTPEEPWLRVPVPDVTGEGPEVTIFLDRRYLIKALEFGLNSISLTDPVAPLRFHSQGKQMIVMPLRQDGDHNQAPRSGEMDYLVAELKRPSKKIDDVVITQIKKYAMAVARDERFHGVPAKWKFVAISNEMNDYAKSDSNQTGRPRGLVWASDSGDITVWVREWAEVINTARARLNFVNAKLAYEANRESSKDYLQKAHAKFIPNVDQTELDDSDDDGGEKEGAE
jgi:hypothetical protein